MPPVAAALQRLLFFPSVCSFHKRVCTTRCVSGSPAKQASLQQPSALRAPSSGGVRGFCLFFLLFPVQFYIFPQVTQPAELLSLWAKRKGAGRKLVLAAAQLSHPVAGFEMPMLCPGSSQVNQSCGGFVRALGTGL